MRKYFTKQFGTAFSVTIIPTLKDNFSYLIHDITTGTLAAVDVNADLQPILTYLQDNDMLDNDRYCFCTILSTHKHWDHTGGNEQLRDTLLKSRKGHEAAQSAPPFTIVGGVKDEIAGVTKKVQQSDTFEVGALRVDVHDVPCHTRGHVLYKVHHPKFEQDGAALFTGDTMFLGGIGAFFEGTAEDMCRAMHRIYHLNKGNDYKLDDKTFIFPGHEYTAGFMRFSEQIISPHSQPDTDFVRKQAELYAAAVSKGLPSVPSSLQDEKRQNMFLRVIDESFCAMMRKGDKVQLMDYLYNACD